MGQYAVQRIILAIPVVLGVTIILFAAVRVVPGDIASARLGDQANPALVEELREDLGLNRPLYVQYFSWLGGIIQLDFGDSLWTGRPVIDNIARAAPVTLQLGVLSILIAVLIAIPFGVASAAAQDKWPDYVLRLISITGLALPNFWLATLVITFAAVWWNWTPVVGAPSITDQPDNIIKYGLAASIIGLSSSAIILRMTRAMMLEVLHQDYMRTAKAKGLAEGTVLIRHGLRNALIPVFTLIGNQFGLILSGSVVIEQVFGLPGLGRLLVDGISQRDYPQIEASVLMFAVGFVSVNLMVDILYGAIDPRIQYQS
ncbi:MAG TPA: ABC transporter permease [Dehalococcoidia bacterium]|nr:ABC transporter permease [Dehalococcoidia bacterium]